MKTPQQLKNLDINALDRELQHARTSTRTALNNFKKSETLDNALKCYQAQARKNLILGLMLNSISL